MLMVLVEHLELVVVLVQGELAEEQTLVLEVPEGLVDEADKAEPEEPAVLLVTQEETVVQVQQETLVQPVTQVQTVTIQTVLEVLQVLQVLEVLQVLLEEQPDITLLTVAQ